MKRVPCISPLRHRSRYWKGSPFVCRSAPRFPTPALARTQPGQDSPATMRTRARQSSWLFCVLSVATLPRVCFCEFLWLPLQTPTNPPLRRNSVTLEELRPPLRFRRSNVPTLPARGRQSETTDPTKEDLSSLHTAEFPAQPFAETAIGSLSAVTDKRSRREGNPIRW